MAAENDLGLSAEQIAELAAGYDVPIAVPKPLTLDGVFAAALEDTKLEKNPCYEWVPGPNSKILFQVEKIITGSFGSMVLSSDLRELNPKTGRYIQREVNGYHQEGKDGPKTPVKVEPGELLRIPSNITTAAAKKKVPVIFKEGSIYCAWFVEEKRATNGVKKVTAIAQWPGDDWPEEAQPLSGQKRQRQE